ncbi:hypothetical protein Drorol1_Dr00000334 [Drosera rotundifolia]
MIPRRICWFLSTGMKQRSTLFALACILENVPFINGSPQKTFVPGLIEFAIKRNRLIGGDDFKSGQTKMKSVNCVGISSGEPTPTPTIKTVNLFSMSKFLELKDLMPQGLPIESSPKKSVQYQIALVSGFINQGIHERVKHAVHASNAK